MSKSPRRSTSLTLDAAMIDEAKALGVNVSRAAEAGLAVALKAARTEAWQRENAAGIQAWNDYIDKHGLPLEACRLF